MTDNFYHNCPADMGHGRHLRDFKTATRRNELIKWMSNITRNDQYRLFLQLNGKKILDNEWNFHKNRNNCWVNDCVHNYPLRSTTRHFVQEREAYDSIYNFATNKRLAPMRRCFDYEDYRMHSTEDYRLLPIRQKRRGQ